MVAIKKKELDREIVLLSKKINALNNRIRLTILGLLYIEEIRSFSQLADEIKIDSNKLAYHLNILTDSKLISKRENGYVLTNEAEEILIDIGFIEEIKDLIEPKPKEKTIIEPKEKYADLYYKEIMKRKYDTIAKYEITNLMSLWESLTNSLQDLDSPYISYSLEKIRLTKRLKNFLKKDIYSKVLTSNKILEFYNLRNERPTTIRMSTYERYKKEEHKKN